MNTFIDTLIVFFWPIAFVCFVCATIGWIIFIFGDHCEVDIKDMTIRPGFRDITLVCMDCKRHLSGPPIGRAVISHGLCKPCADLRWEELRQITERDRQMVANDPLRLSPAGLDSHAAPLIHGDGAVRAVNR